MKRKNIILEIIVIVIINIIILTFSLFEFWVIACRVGR